MPEIRSAFANPTPAYGLRPEGPLTSNTSVWKKLNIVSSFKGIPKKLGYKDNRSAPDSAGCLRNISGIKMIPGSIKTLLSLNSASQSKADIKSYIRKIDKEISALENKKRKLEARPDANKLGVLFKREDVENKIEKLRSEKTNFERSMQYGGKFMGLERLHKLTQWTDAKVPDFMGLEYREIKEIVENEVLPERLNAFLKSCEDKNPNARFMVRSSSTLEDQSGQSNAGCFETVSNVENAPESLIAAIKTVYESFNSDKAQAQTASYANHNAPGSSDRSHGAIVIQLMVGETRGEDSTIPGSGVGLSPDPRSHAPGTFNINAAHGHGEGVVQGLVPTDETLGIIDRKTGEAHARTRVVNQDFRLGPSGTSAGLVERKNPENLRHAPVLSQQAIQTYAQMLDILSQQHETGADMEFVVQGDGKYVVQQRSQDALNNTGEPAYLTEAFVKNNALHKVNVVSYGNYGVNHITPEQRLVADSLDAAFSKDFLGMAETAQKQLKAVFVRPPANPNAHAALMFRQQGVAIIEVSDAKIHAQIRNATGPLLLDEQRGLIGAGITAPEDAISKGHFSYPAPAVYSLPSVKSNFSESQKETLKRLIDLANKPDPGKRQPILTCLAQLKTEIIKGEKNTDKAKQLLARLFYRVYYNHHVNMAIVKRADDDPIIRVFNELTLDLVRMYDAIEENADTMHKLLYLNWIDAAIRQTPQEHAETEDVASLKSTISTQKTNKAFIRWFSDVKDDAQRTLTANARNPKDLSTEGKAALLVLHRLSYAMAQPELKNRWLSSLSHYARSKSATPGQLVDLCNHCVRQWNSGAFEAMVGDLTLQSNEPVIPLDKCLTAARETDHSLEKVKKTNARLSALQAAWSSPANFDERLEVLRNLKKDIELPIKRMNPQKPFHAMAVSKELGNIYEQIDLALKSILTSQNYEPDLRTTHFIEVLKQFNELATPLLEKAYSHSHQSSLTAFKAKFTDIIGNLSEVNLALTKDFSVGESIITRAVTTYSSRPKSIGDIHTLLHQNIRMALGKLVLDTGGIRCIPKKGYEIYHALKSILPERISGLEINSWPFLTSITLGEEIQWQYALPLRTHGIRLMLTLDEKKNQIKVAIAMDGPDENNRYQVAQRIVETARATPLLAVKGFQKGKSAWPDRETATENAFSWVESSGNPNKIADRISGIVRHVVDTSFEFSEGPFKDNQDFINRTNRLFKASPKFQELAEAGNNEVNINKLTSFLHDRLSKRKFSELQTIDTSLKEQQCPLSVEINEAQIKSEIKNRGVMEGKLSLFEFVKMLDTLYCNKPIAKRLLNNHPDLYWSLTQDQLDCLEDLSKTQSLHKNFITDLPWFTDALSNKTTYESLYFSGLKDKTKTDFGKALNCINNLMNASLNQTSINQATELLRSAPKSSGHFKSILGLMNTNPVSDEKIKSIYEHKDALMKLLPSQIENLKDKPLITVRAIEKAKVPFYRFLPNNTNGIRI